MSWVCEDFSNLNDCCFLCYAGLIVWQTDPAGPWLSHLWSSDVKTCHVRVYVFIFLWEKSLRRQTGTMAEGSTQPRPSPGKRLFKGSLQRCQIWTQAEPSRSSGVACFGWEVGEILLCLGMSQFLWTHRLLQKCELINLLHLYWSYWCNMKRYTRPMVCIFFF